LKPLRQGFRRRRQVVCAKARAAAEYSELAQRRDDLRPPRFQPGRQLKRRAELFRRFVDREARRIGGQLKQRPAGLRLCSPLIAVSGGNGAPAYSGGHNHCAPVGRAASRIST
jgi:hypothetical protein